MRAGLSDHATGRDATLSNAAKDGNAAPADNAAWQDNTCLR